jgi:hypothetical protein
VDADASCAPSLDTRYLNTQRNPTMKLKLPSIPRIKKALYADWSLRVRTRDGFKCLLCGATENLTSHHWVCSDHHAHTARYAIANGATLCYACHIRGIHSRADYVSVMKLRDVLNPSASDLLGISQLINTELTTPILRELWDGMRKRVITDFGQHLAYHGKKLFLHKSGHQIAVVDNVLRIPNGQFYCADYEVTVVTKAADGYRYTLKRLETEV